MNELENIVEVERLCAEENGLVFATKNGCGRLVVMNIDYSVETMNKILEAKTILSGLDDFKKGKTQGWQDSNI